MQRLLCSSRRLSAFALVWMGSYTLLTSLSCWVRFLLKGKLNPFSELSQIDIFIFTLPPQFLSLYVLFLFVLDLHQQVLPISLLGSVSSNMLIQPGFCWTALNDLCKVTSPQQCYILAGFKSTLAQKNSQLFQILILLIIYDSCSKLTNSLPMTVMSELQRVISSITQTQLI